MYSDKDHLTVGFPHSEIHGSKPARGSPWLIATCYVLHRLSMPSHPPNALNALDPNPQSHKLRPKASAHSALQLVIYTTTGSVNDSFTPPDNQSLGFQLGSQPPTCGLYGKTARGRLHQIYNDKQLFEEDHPVTPRRALTQWQPQTLKHSGSPLPRGRAPNNGGPGKI